MVHMANISYETLEPYCGVHSELASCGSVVLESVHAHNSRPTTEPKGKAAEAQIQDEGR